MLENTVNLVKFEIISTRVNKYIIIGDRLLGFHTKYIVTAQMISAFVYATRIRYNSV